MSGFSLPSSPFSLDIGRENAGGCVWASLVVDSVAP